MTNDGDDNNTLEDSRSSLLWRRRALSEMPLFCLSRIVTSFLYNLNIDPIDEKNVGVFSGYGLVAPKKKLVS